MGFGFTKSSRTKTLAIVLVIYNISNMNWGIENHPDFCHGKESIFSMFWERERENRWMSSLHSGDIWTQKLQLEDIDNDDWLRLFITRKRMMMVIYKTRTRVPTQAPFWRIGIVANVIVLMSSSQLYEMMSSMQCLSFVLFVLNNYTCFLHQICTPSIINPATEVVFDRRPF